jgi:DNA-binding Lrp family transcriptional regulator
MHDKLDLTDARILEALATHGPRNITKVARELHLPRGTVISRIRRMSSSFYLRLNTSVYHTNLGMKKAAVFIRAALGQEELLFNCMKAHSFYIYLTRCFGMFEGCAAVYIIPIEHTGEFELFLQELRKSGVAQEMKVFWSTCFHTVNLTAEGFDAESNSWTFAWDKWLKEIQTADTELPYTLKDPAGFPQKADETDVFIIKELEKDATTTLASLARQLRTTLQNVRYHYEEHLIKRGLLESFQIAILPFDNATSEMLFFILKFTDETSMAKFAKTLLNKPFVRVLGKTLKENSMVAQVYLPRSELRNFTDALSELARTGFLENYEYVFQDLRPGKWSRMTIPYELFKNRSWSYDHKAHAEALHELIAKSATQRAK